MLPSALLFTFVAANGSGEARDHLSRRWARAPTQATIEKLWRGTVPYDRPLAECARQSAPPRSLAECVNLAPAGTGTQTVHDTLQALVPAAAKINGSWHHSHERRIPQLRGTTCYVMSVRDPAERLRSGLCCLCCLCNKLARHWFTPKTSLTHCRRDVPGSCRAHVVYAVYAISSLDTGSP